MSPVEARINSLGQQAKRCKLQTRKTDQIENTLEGKKEAMVREAVGGGYVTIVLAAVPVNMERPQ